MRPIMTLNMYLPYIKKVKAVMEEKLVTDEIYIITGDRDGGDTYSYGLMKSTDGGSTFGLTGLSFNITNYYKGNRVLIDPSNTNTIIVATSNGIYRSIDFGVSFVLTYSGVNMTDIEFHQQIRILFMERQREIHQYINHLIMV